MTSSRDSRRQELQSLAKLADSLRKERAPDMRSSGEWSVAELAQREEAAVESAPAPVVRLSNSTVPPVVQSYAPPFGKAPARPASIDAKRERMVIVGTMAMLAVAAGLFGTAGRTLLGKVPVTAQAAAAQPAAAAAAPGAAVQKVDSAAVGAPPPASPSPTASEPAALGSDSAPSPAMAAQTAPAGHRPLTHAPAPVAAPVVAKPAAVAAHPAAKKAGGPDSLDDLMRKAVNSPPK